MLIDPRHQRFIDDFCDAWLNLRDIELTSPDQQLYPEFDRFLQDSMLRETRGFVTALIADNLPVRYIVESDFAILNNRLAEHYSLPGVAGPQMRSRSARGGQPAGRLIESSQRAQGIRQRYQHIARGAWRVGHGSHFGKNAASTTRGCLRY